MSSIVGTKLPPYPTDQFTWLKGDPTAVPPPGKPAIIELWATWCPPCRQVIPHLSKLQQEFAERGLVVVGISLEEPSSQLTAFVASQGDKMSYTVTASEKVAQELMSLAGVSGIPHSLVVDSGGTVAYSGHPADPAFVETVKKVTMLCGQQSAPEPKQLPRITASREELAAQPVRELKQILSDRGVSFAGLAEKIELVDRILETCTNVTYYGK